MQRSGDLGCGCDDEKCSEMLGTMSIINEFKQLYEDKMRIIDGEGGGDCNKQAKINLQQDWIRDLTEQNEMLVRAVEELEQEATERVLALEKKLQQTSQNASQTMESLKLKDDEIENLKRKLEETSQATCMLEAETLKQSMLEMRDALTAEVADKHDTIVSLKREVQLLEDQCRKADQQTHFKDDIIKELRKEIKQYKQEKAESCHFPKVSELEEENEELKNAIQEATEKLEEFQRSIDVYAEENLRLQQETKECLKKIEKLEMENATLNENCCQMQTKVQKIEYFEELSLQTESVIKTLQFELEDTRKQNQNAKNEICELNCKLQQSQSPMMKDMSIQCRDGNLPLKPHRHQRKGLYSDESDEESDEDTNDDDDVVDCTFSCGPSNGATSPKRSAREKSPKKITIKDSDTDVSNKTSALRNISSKSGSDTQDNSDDSLVDGIEEKCQKKHIDGDESQKKLWKSAKKKAFKYGKRTAKKLFDKNKDMAIEKVKEIYKKKKNSCIKRMKQKEAELLDLGGFLSDSSLSDIKVLTTISSQECEQPWDQLQDAVHGLKDSVSRMMVKESEVKLANQRIAELEEQVQWAWRTKESEVEAARCCREKEIANLKETIDTLTNNLEDEKNRCQNLQKAGECSQLQKDVVALRDQKQDQCVFVDELNYQLVGCKNELMRLYAILTQEQELMEDESLKLTEHIGILQLEIGNLSQQLKYTIQCADVEKQTKVSLEVALAKKDCEIVCLRNELYVLGEKLKMSSKELAEANGKLHHLQECKEMNICKLQEMSQALANGKQEFEMLSAEYTETVNNLKSVQMELQCCKTCTTEELKQYKDLATNLSEKLKSSEGNQKCLERELISTRTKLEKTVENEAKLLQEKILRDNDLSSYQIEQDRLVNVIANLEQRISLLGCETSKKEQEIAQMRNEFNNQILNQREEGCKLKNEINILVQKQTNLKAENEKLQSQLAKLRTIVTQNDETNQIMARELEQCVTDLNGIQREKEFLIEKNNSLTQEIRALQDACQIKTESVVTLEMELNDTKCIKETLCSESRNVIDNVKSWLHEQRKINVELDNKIKFKNSIIEKLNGKIVTLENKVKSLQRPRQRGGSPPPGSRFQTSSSNCYWSLGSVESPPCSFNGSETDWETVENESTPQVWLHRVESLTEELQKNNRYWKSKMEEVDYVVSRDN